MADEIGNPWIAIKRATAEARTLDNAVSASCLDMASLLQGNLKRVSQRYDGACVLRAIKRDLRDFNMTTGTWNDV